MATIDRDLFAALPGGPEIIAWFGFVPSFHDATLAGLTLADNSATLRLNAFRMTDQVDEQGYFVTDRHAVVTIELSGVTGLSLTGNASSILYSLVIERVTARLSGFETCGGPEVGDYAVHLETSYGLEGSIYARAVSLTVSPAAPSP